jgi:hypothetical protein
MFGIGKKRNFRGDVAKHMTEAGSSISALIANQILALTEKNRVCSREQIWQEPYIRHYIFGAFDALTCEFPLHIRKKVGPAIMELGFLNLVPKAFHVSEQETRNALTECFAFQRDNPTSPDIMDGGADGMKMLERTPATRLLEKMYDLFAPESA